MVTLDTLEQTSTTLPQSWWRAAGLLRHKKINPIVYQRKIRQEWERRLKQLERKRVSGKTSP